MLTGDQRRRVIAEMKRDRPVAWPPEDVLVAEFSRTARDLLGVEVDEADARIAVARGRFMD